MKILLSFIVGIGAALLACGSSDDGAAGATSAQPTEPPAGFGEDNKNGGANNNKSTTSAQSSEQCSNAGATRSCCTTGTQTCTGSGELNNVWGPCVDKDGAPLTCENKEPPKLEVDAGKPEASVGAQCGAGMACKPGSIRYCDDSKIAEWTKSTCSAAGQWGPCEETTAPNGPKCDPDSYSPEKCCPGLKLCCQDDNGPFVDFGTGACAALECK